jgi:hypothetical protein
MDTSCKRGKNAMTLENYVKLVPDVEKVLRIREGSFRIEPRTIRDPHTKAPKIVNAAVMDVIEEDGVPVTKSFSTLGEKLAAALQVAHNNGTLYRNRIGIKRVGTGFVSEYQLRFF